MPDVTLIRRALDHCGYHHAEATEEHLRACFWDYWHAGQFPNLEEEELDELAADRIARILLRL